MARLSGLPSEHHHEGPGDAPRRKRGRPNRTPASSQEPPSSNKRPASPSAEPSQSKRTKRTQVDDESQIAEEIEHSTARTQDEDVIHVETHHSAVIRRPNRRHSEPPIAAPDDEDEDMLMPISSTQPQSGLTPHLNRIGAPRRDLATARRARMSMPAQLHLERVDEELDGTQFQYAPLTAVLDSRTRRRLRRSHLSQEVIDFEDHQKKDKKLLLELRRQLRAQDEKIKDLEYSLEARRMGEIDITDDHAEELEQELALAREEIDKLRASSLYNGSDRELSVLDGTADMSDDEDTQVMLVDPHELHMSQELEYEYMPDGKYAERVKELSSQMTFESLPELSTLTHDTLMEDPELGVPDKIEDKAVERYERELQHYTRKLAESQGALRVLTLELQNLHYLDPGHSGSEVLVQLRHGFHTLRSEVEKFFPNTTKGLTNQQLLHKIPELFSGIFFELKEKISIASSSQKKELLLRRQYEGVLDLLGDSEDRIQELEKNSYSLDKANEEKQRTIVDLEEQVMAFKSLANDQETEMQEKNKQIQNLNDDVEDKDTDLQRLRDALEQYRKDLDNVTQTATDFEAEHNELVARMEEEHADAIVTIRNELDEVRDARDAAESDAAHKGEVIDELEGRIDSMESELVVITDEIAQLRDRLLEQTESRENAEGQRDEQAEIAYENAQRADELDKTVEDLLNQLDDAKSNLAAEQDQREKTEADLDETNEKLEDANQRLHTLGIQANELRAKLFELQQEKEQTIQELQEDATLRENDLEDQVTAEEERRKAAEKTIAKLNAEIDQLQNDLAAANIDYTNMSDAREQLERDREIQAAALNQQLIDLKAKYAALENATKSEITTLQAHIVDLNNEVQRQQAEISRLKDEIGEKDQRYADDTAALQDEITILKSDLADHRDEIDRNRKKIHSLEQRVDHEANELLNIMNSNSEEVGALKTVISTQEATIANLQAMADQRASEHEDLIAQRDSEIEELRLVGTARLETIVLLEASLDDLKAKFAAQEQDTRETIDALNLAHRRLIEENEKLSAAAKQRFETALKAVQNIKVERVELKTQSVDLHPVANGKVIKTAEKVKIGKKGKKKVATRAWRDSGYGMDEVGSSPNGVDAGDVDGEELFAA